MTRLSVGWSRGIEHLPLAAVPLLTALLATEKVQRVAGFRGRHVGLKLSLPVGVVDVWQFVSLPNASVSVGLPLPEALPALLVVLPAAVALLAAVSAGYFGSLAAALETEGYDFTDNVRRYFRPFFVYVLAPVVVATPVVLFGARSARTPVPVLLVVPAIIVAAYLFYATPYLVVLRDTDLLSALRASYGLAVAGGPYFRYAFGYAGFVAAVSVIATAVVVNLGLPGVVLGAVAGAPLGLACNATTMRFVADLDDDSPTLGDWEDDSAAAAQP